MRIIAILLICLLSAREKRDDLYNFNTIADNIRLIKKLDLLTIIVYYNCKKYNEKCNTRL